MTEPRLQTNKTPADPSDKVMGEALAEALVYLKTEWGWSGPDISGVLHIPVSTINNWVNKKYIPVSKPLSPDVQAIIQLVTIHKNLQAMFEQNENQRKWLMTIHPDMRVSPLEKMKESVSGLVGVRQYLDYIRGRGA